VKREYNLFHNSQLKTQNSLFPEDITK